MERNDTSKAIDIVAASNTKADPIKTQPEEQNLIVALRIRPMNEDEIIQGATPVAHVVENITILMDPFEDPDDILRANRSREKQYVFDCAFDGGTTQAEVYEQTAKLIIPSVVNGFNATVFAYGATGAGKTYTMLGRDEDPGIMARTLNDLFLEMDRTSDDMKYNVTMSYLEIYNEMIRDLLNPQAGYLELREDAKGVQVTGLSEFSARTTIEIMDMLQKGNKERTQEPTAANKTSSRSHAILQVTIKQQSRITNVMEEVRVGKLFLIDLAGSERAANTHNKGKRMVEGAHINRSLLALGNCINALSEKDKSKYVNYRDSKLTRLLKDALGGNCKTIMIAHVSPASIHFEESRNTLVYADRAKHIKTKVRKNVMDVSYHIAQYTNIICELREEIKRLRDKINNQAENKNTSAIQAIQSEVLKAARTEDQTELNKLKEQLLAVFNDQMELRRSLMELNNTAMEITLETTRNHLLIQKYEQEKALGIRKRIPEGLSPEEEKAYEKQLELEGGDELPEPEDIKQAKDELKSLQSEKDKTEKLKNKVTKELENSKDRAARIEVALPKKVNSDEQAEILSLLCKVHELEIETMEMQSSCLLRNFEIRRKDMVISKHWQHHNLCDEIIQQQKTLIEEHQIPYPKELEELYELYHQENASLTTLNRRFLESDSMSDMDKFSVIDGDTGSKMGSQILAKKQMLLKKSSNNLNKLEETSSDKIFSRSAKAQEIREAAAQEELLATKSTTTLHQRQKSQHSIITLSSRSNATSPSPANTENTKPPPNPVEASPVKKAEPEDKMVISSKTRNIAALAAKRRNKAQLDAYNNEKLQENNSNTPDNYLSASRLAHHDKKYGSTLTLRHLVDADQYSTGTADASLLDGNTRPRRPKYRNTKKSQAAINRTLPKSKRSRINDPGNYQQHVFVYRNGQLSKAVSRKAVDQASVTSMASRRSKLLHPPQMSKTPRSHLDDDVQEFESEPSNRTVYQKAPDRGKGLTVKKRVRGPGTSNVSTPQGRAARKAPTIPNYGRMDGLGVTGNSLQR